MHGPFLKCRQEKSEKAEREGKESESMKTRSVQTCLKNDELDWTLVWLDSHLVPNWLELVGLLSYGEDRTFGDWHHQKICNNCERKGKQRYKFILPISSSMIFSVWLLAVLTIKLHFLRKVLRKTVIILQICSFIISGASLRFSQWIDHFHCQRVPK